MSVHMTYSQTPRIQKGKNNTTILSSEETIDKAKIVSDWRRQKTEISSLQAKIDSLSNLYDKLEKSYKESLEEVSELNKVIRDHVVKGDEVSDELLKKERNRWKGLHLYGELQVPNFETDSIYFSLNLNYELERFTLGVTGGPSLNNQFNYSGYIAYKIF